MRLSGTSNLVSVHVTGRPSALGGGSNTFAYNFRKWLTIDTKAWINVRKLLDADLAVVIADRVDVCELKEAKAKGCFIIHRLDEFIERDESAARREKHSRIREINRFADVTVFQSNFVEHNMRDFLPKTSKQIVIYNGADPRVFSPAPSLGISIGHVTWSVDPRKRLDLVFDLIKKRPAEQFLLVGNHLRSGLPFEKLPNTQLVTAVPNQELCRYFHQMKFLFFPSENDPCPNTVIEAMLAGLPICYSDTGGTPELVRDCGAPLEKLSVLESELDAKRKSVLRRTDLFFDDVVRQYLRIYGDTAG